MSEAVLPTLPGLEWNVKKSPMFRTKIQSAVSGKELRSSFMAYPLWKFRLSYSVLRSAAEFAELQTLLGFFLQRRGSFDTFLYTDPDDNSVTDHSFGTGNGTTAGFQLLRTLGGFAEPVQNLNGTPTIKVAGITKTVVNHYNIGSTGIVTFTAGNIPTSGQVLTWTGSFYIRVRFLQDEAEFNQFLYQLFDLKKLEFQSVKL